MPRPIQQWRRICIIVRYQHKQGRRRQHQLLPLQHLHPDQLHSSSSRQLQQQTVAIFTIVLPRLIDLLALKFEGKSLSPFDTHPLLMAISIIGILLFSFASYIEITRIFRIGHIILGTLVIAMLSSILIQQYYPLIWSFLITYLILCAFVFFNWFLGMFKHFYSWFICCFVSPDRISHGTSAQVSAATSPAPHIPSTSAPTPKEEEDSPV